MIESLVNSLIAYVTGLLPDWWPWAAWGIGALIVLTILANVKTIAGWPGVVAVVGAASAVAGYIFGRRSVGKPTPPPKKPKPRPFWDR